jgi:hypothetical protein
VQSHGTAGAAAAARPPHTAPAARSQLFDLAADPKESTDLAPLPAHAPTLARLRAAMVQQFEREGRGPAWVKDGRLVPRPTSQKYGPNYPGDRGLTI